ncbi:MAG: pseudouridine synthase [Bdellovibrionales bacterium]
MASGKSETSVRLNKFIADCGIASRRKADGLIEEGAVKVNDRVVYELGQKVVPGHDRVKVNGKLIRVESNQVYIIFNKPKEVLTSTEDPTGRKTVGDYFEQLPERVFPVGRLDFDSEGLLLITNDGEFAQKVSHPKNEIPKTYHVKLDDHIEDSKLQKLRNGVSIAGGGRVSAKQIRRLRKGSKNKDWIEIVITEGKNRQVRKMFEKVGRDVEKLQRVSIGSLSLGKLERGRFKTLTKRQLEKVFEDPYDEDKSKKKVSKKKVSEKKAKTTESSQRTAQKKADQKKVTRKKSKSKSKVSKKTTRSPISSAKKKTKKKKQKRGILR